MRISIDPKDRAYREDTPPEAFRVSLDGEFVLLCQTADTDEGMVKRAKMEGNRIAIDSAGNVVFEVLYGVVKIHRIGTPFRP